MGLFDNFLADVKKGSEEFLKSVDEHHAEMEERLPAFDARQAERMAQMPAPPLTMETVEEIIFNTYPDLPLSEVVFTTDRTGFTIDKIGVKKEFTLVPKNGKWFLVLNKTRAIQVRSGDARYLTRILG